jgi:AcrR family transcriptional regulator
MKPETRSLILKKAYEQMRLHGYQGLRTEMVIEELNITKGALYHYFPGKKELALSVVDEIIAEKYMDTWRGIKGYEDNAIDFIVLTLEWMLKRSTEKEIRLGDPLNNLIQEMSALDDDFRNRLEKILEEITGMIQQALKKGKKGGNVKETVSARQASLYIVATIMGAYSVAKLYQSHKTFERIIESLIDYLLLLKQ